MEILVGSQQMKQCDRNTIEHFGVPSLVLMERAALGVVDEIERLFGQEKSQERASHSILVVCGLGNNGGDGLAIGRMLWQKGYDVVLVMPPNREKASAETRKQMEILGNYGVPIGHAIPKKEFWAVVDALFGIGLGRDLEGIYQDYIVDMNQKEGWKVAVDIPSGIHADTGQVMGIGFRAELTVTFAFATSGLVLYPGAEYAGEVRVKQIGIDRNSFLTESPDLYLTKAECLARIPRRQKDSNKGTYGKVLTVAGSRNMAGAAFLSAKASYRTGAGLVKILTEESNRVILQQLLPEAILATYEALDDEGEEAYDINSSLNSSQLPMVKDVKNIFPNLSELLHWASAVTIGPGLGTGEEAKFLVESVLKTANVPVILDADGLNILSERLEWLKEVKAPVILTPHLGEMARLTKTPILAIKEKILQAARSFAAEYNVICILKDARTVTALPNQQAYINATGNNGMATAGSGDVLTGILAGLIAQGMEPTEAAPLGVCLHGVAADCQASQIAPHAMMAQDILAGISSAYHSGSYGRLAPVNHNQEK